MTNTAGLLINSTWQSYRIRPRDRSKTWFGLQRSLNEGLGNFVGGSSLTRVNRLFYPWIDQLSGEYWITWRQRTEDLLGRVDGNIPYLRPVSGIVSGIKPAIVAGWLAQLATWLDSHMPGDLVGESPRVFIPCLKRFKHTDYAERRQYLDPILRLQNYAASHLSRYVLGVYLHGSMSTLDYVPGSSDLDALAVVNLVTICHADQLLLFRRKLIHTLRWFYQIDYAQHHGYAILSELDLRFYSESLFPSTLFAYLTPLTGVCGLTIQTSKEEVDLVAPCEEMSKFLRHTIESPMRLWRWFDQKLTLQSVLLLPTLYLQAHGIHVYKRNSFALAREHFTDNAWTIVEKASQIRNLGLQQNIVTFWAGTFSANLPSPWLASFLLNRIHRRIPAQAGAILGEQWIQETICFLDEIDSALRKIRVGSNHAD